MRIVLAFFAVALLALGIAAWQAMPSKSTISLEVREERDRQHRAIADAKRACLEAIRDRATFPSEVEAFGVFDATVGTTTDGLVGVRGRTELMNGFGMKIPHVFGCDVRGTEVVTVVLGPG